MSENRWPLFEYIRSKKKIGCPVGGVELNIGFYLNPQINQDYEGINDVPASEHFYPILDCWSEIRENLSETLIARDRLFNIGNAHTLEQIFLPTGDALKLETQDLDISIMEICTGEVRDSSTLCLCLWDLTKKINDSLGGTQWKEILHGVSHPGFLPRFGRRRHFELGFHVNIFKDESPYLVEIAEMESALSCLMPLAASGGIGPNGFCISPQSSALAIGSHYMNRHDPQIPYRVTVKRNVRIGRSIVEEERFHIPMDPPFSFFGIGNSFAIAQLLVVMASQGYSPLKGLKLKNAARARTRWSENPAAKCLLQTGKQVRAWDLLLLLRSQISSFLQSFSLHESLEETAERIIRGSLIAASNDEDYDEYLVDSFEYYMKKHIYENLLRNYFGVTLKRFSTLSGILYKLGIPTNEVTSSSPQSLRKTIARLPSRRSEAISRLLLENRIGYAELMSGAHMYKKIEAAELALGRFYPHKNEYIERLKDSYLEALQERAPDQSLPTRADARKRLIYNLNMALASTGKRWGAKTDNIAFCMDWSNFFSISVKDDHIRLCIQPMGDPKSAHLETPFPLYLKPGMISQIAHSFPGGKLFAAIVSSAVDLYISLESLSLFSPETDRTQDYGEQ